MKKISKSLWCWKTYPAWIINLSHGSAEKFDEEDPIAVDATSRKVDIKIENAVAPGRGFEIRKVQASLEFIFIRLKKAYWSY